MCEEVHFYKFAGLQAYSQHIYYQMNSFTGIFRQHFKLSHDPWYHKYFLHKKIHIKYFFNSILAKLIKVNNLSLLLVVNNTAFEEGKKLLNFCNGLIAATTTVSSKGKLLLCSCFVIFYIYLGISLEMDVFWLNLFLTFDQKKISRGEGVLFQQ